MKELVIGFVSSLINTIVAVIGFCKGPIAVGIIAGAFILSFSSGAEASVVGEVTPNVRSFSEKFSAVLWIAGVIGMVFLVISDNKEKSSKTSFQMELDDAIQQAIDESQNK